MKQKVVTKAIIKQNGRILLLRRSGGRPSIAGLYELPGGRVHIHQQPEDALRHAFDIHLGTTLETVQLRDVMTFIDPDDRELQYVFIIFEASIVRRELRLSSEYNRYIWKKMSEIQLAEVTQSTQQLLGMVPIVFWPHGRARVVAINDGKGTTAETVIAYSDGGSRGNPGPSASGYVLLNVAGDIIFEGGSFLGISTNNVAEYQAVYLALEKALEFGAIVVDMRMDSQLVANQMNGVYRIKHPELAAIHHRIQELSAQFVKVTYTHVAREYNVLADGMVNKILDQHQQGTS